MIRFYQGIVMAVVVLSAGIIGQMDAAQEMERKQQLRAEGVHQEQQVERHPTVPVKTAMAERSYQLP